MLGCERMNYVVGGGSKFHERNIIYNMHKGSVGWVGHLGKITFKLRSAADWSHSLHSLTEEKDTLIVFLERPCYLTLLGCRAVLGYLWLSGVSERSGPPVNPSIVA